MRSKTIAAIGFAFGAVLCGSIGGMAQTSLMRILGGTAQTPGISDTTFQSSGFSFLNGFVQAFGHLASQNGIGAGPTLSTCGSSPAPVLATGSTDTAGTYTTGGTATTCTITFGNPYAVEPACSLDNAGGSATQPTFTVSNTAITVSVDIAQTKYDYICIAKAGG